jgi:hypothetical protein
MMPVVMARYNYQKGTVTAFFEYGSVMDPDSRSGSGSKRANMAHKNIKQLKNVLF